MIGPIECLEKERERIQVEINFTTDTELQRPYEELAEAYMTAINLLKSSIK